MDEEAYRLELRELFLGQLKSTLKKRSASVKKPTKGNSLDCRHSNQEAQSRKVGEFDGGDADRLLCSSSSYTNTDESQSSSKSVCSPHSKIKSTQTSFSYSSRSKCSSGSLYTSNLDSYNITRESEGSRTTHKTIISKMSSEELRKIVKSKCKIAEVIDETIKRLNVESNVADTVKHKSFQAAIKPPFETLNKPTEEANLPICSRCGEKFSIDFGKKHVTAKTNDENVFHCHSGEMLTISVDDIVNTKVINPMIRKLQRMYLNSLREEISLLEDLELLPHRVSEVYKATIFKSQDKN